jgi:hypothetical protein
MMRPDDRTTPAFVTRVEAFARTSQGELSVENAIKSLVQTIRAARAGSASGVLQGGDVIPGLSVSIVVRVWGGPLARRDDLLAIAEWITLAKLPQLQQNAVHYNTTSVNRAIDLMGRFVEVEKNILAAGLSRVVGEEAGVDLSLLPNILSEDDIVIPPEVTKGGRMRVATTGNPTALPGFNVGPKQTDMRWPRNLTDQTRGDYSRLCVAAALSSWQDGPDVPPPLPPNFSPKLTPTY